MQSEERRHGAGIDPSEAHYYGLFHLAGTLGAPYWRNCLSLAFPASDIADLDGSEITPGCIGLLGMAGALPYAYTEAVARAGGSAAREFMDLLSAPAVDAFCATWRAARPEPQLLPKAAGPLRARAIGELLAQALGVPIQVEQFAGRWEALPPEQRSTMGGGYARCGEGALLGERLWRVDSAVRVVVGPLNGAQAMQFVPGSAGASELAEHWRRLAEAGCGISAEACIRLRAGAAEGATLGRTARLGYDAMLLSRPNASERDDLRYSLC